MFEPCYDASQPCLTMAGALLASSPGNPSGGVFGPENLAAIADLHRLERLHS